MTHMWKSNVVSSIYYLACPVPRWREWWTGWTHQRKMAP